MSRKNVIVREVGQVFVQLVHVVNLRKIRFVLTGINNKAGNFRVRVKATNSNLGPDEKVTANGITRGRNIRIESFVSLGPDPPRAIVRSILDHPAATLGEMFGFCCRNPSLAISFSP